jgi:hypothetical protein
MTQPKHRKHALTKTRPRLQRPGRHRGEYVPETTVGDRQTADLINLMYAIGPGNPFRGRS